MGDVLTRRGKGRYMTEQDKAERLVRIEEKVDDVHRQLTALWALHNGSGCSGVKLNRQAILGLWAFAIIVTGCFASWMTWLTMKVT